ncbi:MULTISPECIES: SDR family oxidoreductase [Microbacterium]|uniref:SDR family oxidoreductase n=1 Tax=Microbacterium TaxID=33882 RepID=UPI00146CB645|nr:MULTISPECIES: SDR family oxidoreductase [Microbacterium]
MSHALVLGASRGLGAATAQRLAADGIHVHLLARDLDRLTALVTGIRESGGHADAHAVDATEPEGFDAQLAALADRYPIRRLLINSGGPRPAGFDQLTDTDWHDAGQGTLMVAVRALRAVRPGMVSAGFGRIVVVGSSSVRQPIDGLLLSNVYRAGVLALVKSLTPELMAAGVTINMLSPGRIDTDRVRSLDAARAARTGGDPTDVRAESIRRIPAGRYGTPAEFADAAAFLLSDTASYLTGQSILVDGGLVTALP